MKSRWSIFLADIFCITIIYIKFYVKSLLLRHAIAPFPKRLI